MNATCKEGERYGGWALGRCGEEMVRKKGGGKKPVDSP